MRLTNHRPRIPTGSESERACEQRAGELTGQWRLLQGSYPREITEFGGEPPMGAGSGECVLCVLVCV